MSLAFIIANVIGSFSRTMATMNAFKDKPICPDGGEQDTVQIKHGSKTLCLECPEDNTGKLAIVNKCLWKIGDFIIFIHVGNGISHLVIVRLIKANGNMYRLMLIPLIGVSALVSIPMRALSVSLTLNLIVSTYRLRQWTNLWVEELSQ